MDIDFSSMLASGSVAGLVGVIIALGYILITPNFIMWAVDKVAGFFGYDPYDRDNKHED